MSNEYVKRAKKNSKSIKIKYSFKFIQIKYSNFRI